MCARRGIRTLLPALFLSPFLALCALSQQQGGKPPSSAGPGQSQSNITQSQAETDALNTLQQATHPNIVFKPDAKKAKESYKEGLQAEKRGDWQAAFQEYSDAVNFAPDNRDYLVSRELARSHIVQFLMDKAEKDAVGGHLTEALKTLRSARDLDPSNPVLRERLTELSALLPHPYEEVKQAAQLAEPTHIEHQAGKKSFDFRGNSTGAYEEVARQFGVNVAFDIDLQPRPVRIRFEDVDFFQALDLVGIASGTFWRPLTKHLFFVSADTPQKRKDYGASAVRTVILPASESDEQMTETFRLVREIAGLTRSDLDRNTRTITMRGSPQSLAVATNLLDDLEKPTGELVLEINVLEVDRTYASNIGIVPPQTAQIFTLSSQQIQEAQQSTQGLLNVISQVFGLPSILSGLSSEQAGALISSGQIGLGTLIPPVLAFGGGKTTFLYTLPGATANLGEMLSMVKSGRRILLRAEDGKPATFFVGDRIPISLAQFSASLGGGAALIPGVSTTNFPVTEFATGNNPQFVVAGDTRNNSTQDLLVANFADNTLSVLLGNGDGTFADQVTYPTGTGPVWVATGDFNGDKNLDVAVADNTANTISILLGKGDGTFGPKTDIKTGNAPQGLVAANFHDLNGKNDLDLAVANSKDNTISVFPGNGDGTFGTPTLLTTGNGPFALAVGDFNKDNHMDLVVTNRTDNTAQVFLGKGDGTFQQPVTLATGATPLWVSVADFNNDGNPDLAIANNGAPTNTLSGNSVTIILGNGDGTFNAAGAQSFRAGNGPTSIAVADYNIDGFLDLAVTDQTDNVFSLLLGLGDGTFGPNVQLNVGTNPLSSFTADFNGDNRPDLAVANAGSNNVSVILNQSQFSPGQGLAPTQFPGVQYLDVGVKVKATPRVLTSDEVSLQLNVEISDVTSTSFNGIPVIANQTVEQTVRVKNEEAAALAGFHQLQRSNAINGTPGIGTVPGIGLLAGNQVTQNDDTDLMIFITPHLVSRVDRKDHTIYAGRGAPEGPSGPVAGPFRPAGRFGVPAANQPQPAEEPVPAPQPQPGTVVTPSPPLQPQQQPAQQPVPTPAPNPEEEPKPQ
jgi:hypothetical protein